MDFGPHGSADVTENLTESVPCGPVVHDPAEPEQDPQGLPYLHIKAPFHALNSPIVKEVCDVLLTLSPLFSTPTAYRTPASFLAGK